MENYAGRNNVDIELEAELTFAGITPEKLPECMRNNMGEVRSIIIGTLHGWSFKRNWYYWVCEGPGIPVTEAEELHKLHGTFVRVNGSCVCPSPREHFKGLGCGLYHVDNMVGLKALADTIKLVVDKYGRED